MKTYTSSVNTNELLEPAFSPTLSELKFIHARYKALSKGGTNEVLLIEIALIEKQIAELENPNTQEEDAS